MVLEIETAPASIYAATTAMDAALQLEQSGAPESLPTCSDPDAALPAGGAWRSRYRPRSVQGCAAAASRGSV